MGQRVMPAPFLFLIMQIDRYTDKGFIRYAEMRSDETGKYRQGIVVNKLLTNMDCPGVYVLCNCTDGSVEKIGETADFEARMRMYVSIVNTTNNRVRNQVKFSGLDVYVYPTPVVSEIVMGHKCLTSFQKDLEKYLLMEFRKENDGRLPLLNACNR